MKLGLQLLGFLLIVLGTFKLCLLALIYLTSLQLFLLGGGCLLVAYLMQVLVEAPKMFKDDENEKNIQSN